MYKLIATSPNDDGTFNMIVKHKETGEVKRLRNCYPLEIGGMEDTEDGAINVEFKFDYDKE